MFIKQSGFVSSVVLRRKQITLVIKGCEMQIETSVMWVTFRHHEACSVVLKQLSRMTEEQQLLSMPFFQKLV